MLQFLWIAVGLIIAGTLITYATLGIFIIEPSGKSDEELRSNKSIHDAVMANQRNQGLVLDMDAYYEGRERYISKQEAEVQKSFGFRMTKFLRDITRG